MVNSTLITFTELQKNKNTNMDWWDSRAMDIMDSKKRIRVMNGVLKKSCTVDTLWNTMKKGGNQNICNKITVYSTLFIPSDSKFQYTIGH